MKCARELIEYYRDNVALLITTRLHAALPCIGMGIPVVFIGDRADPRLSILPEIGVPIYAPAPRGGLGRWATRVLDQVDWSPHAVDVSAWADGLRNDVSARISALHDRTAEAGPVTFLQETLPSPA